MTEKTKTYIFLAVCLLVIVSGAIYLSGQKPPSVEIEERMASLQEAIENWHREKGSPPKSLEELGLPDEEIRDIINEVFQYSVSEDGKTVTLRTLGADGKEGGVVFRADKERVFTLGESNGE